MFQKVETTNQTYLWCFGFSRHNYTIGCQNMHRFTWEISARLQLFFRTLTLFPWLLVFPVQRITKSWLLFDYQYDLNHITNQSYHIIISSYECQTHVIISHHISGLAFHLQATSRPQPGHGRSSWWSALMRSPLHLRKRCGTWMLCASWGQAEVISWENYENYGKTMKTMGKLWENYGKLWEAMGYMIASWEN